MRVVFVTPSAGVGAVADGTRYAGAHDCKDCRGARGTGEKREEGGPQATEEGMAMGVRSWSPSPLEHTRPLSRVG